VDNDFHILIPARLASARLPRKALLDVLGQPLVVHVLRCAERCGAASVHVATDSEEIAEVVTAAGGQAVMTSADHSSGTDRLAEAVAGLGFSDQAIVVNLQGDEPEMPAVCIRQVAQVLQDDAQARMATLHAPIQDERQWRDPNVVKLVHDDCGRALYFSRAPIPHVRDGEWPNLRALRHVGLYAYRARALMEWQDLAPGDLERFECLEQLRALQAGWKIAVTACAETIPVGIDTAADLDRFRSSLQD
jgi:3-deoxy-manno-octulosonate cytidylyltransferase (CMP-KDO synthetase)